MRAAVTAFCSITRPSRREIAQLDDLAGPLLNSVGDDTLRFVAACLSESPHAPPMLVRRLADQSTDISAPLLLRSPVLGNIDLLALIGRHGASHARVIAARHQVDERIIRLISSLGVGPGAANEPIFGLAKPSSEGEEAAARESGHADAARERLKGMMLPSSGKADAAAHADIRLRWDGDPGAYRKLRSTALTGVPALFQTALADALDIGFTRASDIAQATDISELIVAMRALKLSDEEAFLIVQCIRPSRLAHVRTISAFFDAYGAVTTAQASAIVEGWRAEDGRGSHESDRTPANQQSANRQLKAS
jgi:uncharacterized protein (DUF2336 family)